MRVLCFCKISDWKSQWTDGFLKDLNRFFSSKYRERVKMHSITKNETRKLFGDFEVGVLFRVILNLARPSG